MSTICAIATPQGQGGIGIVRLSGAHAYAIGCALTHKKLRPRHAHFAKCYDKTEGVIDEAVVIYYQAPYSFTGEDVVEVQAHGSPVLLNALLLRLYELGAVAAKAGEFSQRAFLSGKIDLAQAEAISAMIAARSLGEAKSAQRALQGEWAEAIDDLLAKLIHLRLYIESAIDFSDEEIDLLSDNEFLDKSTELDVAFADLLERAHSGVRLGTGAKVALIGKPNAGKSSLLNALLGMPRAIVSDVAGTTRDAIEAQIVLDGIELELIDTAGLRQSDDAIEQIGIARARQTMDTADICLLVFDVAHTTDIDALINELNAPKDALVLVGNKADLPYKTLVSDMPIFYVSCETGKGLDDLRAHLRARVGITEHENALMARSRHVDALARAKAQIVMANHEIAAGALELGAERLRLAQEALGEITGRFLPDDLLGAIFSTFCLGK